MLITKRQTIIIITMTLSHEFRYYLRHRNYLRNVLRETERALDIINNENLFLEGISSNLFTINSCKHYYTKKNIFI